MTPQGKIVVSDEGLQTLRDGAPGLLMRWDEVFAVSFSKIDAIHSVITGMGGKPLALATGMDSPMPF